MQLCSSIQADLTLRPAYSPTFLTVIAHRGTAKLDCFHRQYSILTLYILCCFQRLLPKQELVRLRAINRVIPAENLTPLSHYLIHYTNTQLHTVQKYVT